MRHRTEIYRSIRPSEKQQAFMHTWEIQREQPRSRYILFHGILREGLIFFLIIKFFQFLIQRDAFALFYSSFQGVLFLFIEILFWGFGGYVIGWFKHNRNEIEYELLKEHNL